MNLDFDYHIHTFHSPCGHDEMLPREIVRLAAQRGMRRIAITDHFYTFTDVGIFDEIRSEVARTIDELGLDLKVYFGCEAEVMAPGRTAGSTELAEMLDFVMVGAVHFTNHGITDLPKGDENFTAHYYLQMFEYGVSLPWASVMAHPFFVFPSVGSASLLRHLSDDELMRGIEVAKKNGVAMEISRRVFTSPEQYEFSVNFLRMCKCAGLKFTIGSDAHALADLSQTHIVKPVVEELELTAEDFWSPAGLTLASAGR